MRGVWLGALALAALVVPGTARAEVSSVLFAEAVAVPAPAPSLALGSPALEGSEDWLAARIGGLTPKAPRKPKGSKEPKTAEAPRPRRAPAVLDANRARILLRSLTVPGWGQATAGHRTSATVFAIAEAGVWGSFTAFRIQESLRRRTTERTAGLFAGIDLGGRDEEFRRIVGSYLSSEEYNRLVVFRDAANLYYDDPVRYRAYIAEHSLGGDETWAWGSVDQLLLYRSQRKNQQRASQRANTVLAVAIANRLVSVIHATRVAGRAPSAPRSWNLECVPAGGDDPSAFVLQVSARF